MKIEIENYIEKIHDIVVTVFPSNSMWKDIPDIMNRYQNERFFQNVKTKNGDDNVKLKEEVVIAENNNTFEEEE